MTKVPEIGTPPAGITGAAIVAEVRKFLGDAYVYGDAGPKQFDCSGLVQYVLESLGMTGVPRTSEQQYAWTQHISANQLQAGDLVFMQFPGDNASPGHVEIYIGGGQMIGADDPARGVAVDSLSSVASNIVGYGRIPAVTTSGATGTGALGTGTANAQIPVSISGVSGLLSGAAGLIHGIAVVLDRFFGLFAKGQGWRFVFMLAAAVALLLAYHAYNGTGISFRTPAGGVTIG